MTTKPTNLTITTDSIVIVHDTGSINPSNNRFRCLFIDQKESSLIDAVEVADETALATLLKARMPKSIISILPGSATICRTSLLPDIDDDQLQEALRLQAESRLLGGTPPHRRALAALESADGESNRIGLIIAWPEETKVDIPEVLQDASFIPETGAVAALFNGCRPTSPIVIADKNDGCVSLALTCPQGIAFRSTRENSASSEIFLKGTLRAVEETATLHNHTQTYTKSLVETLKRTFLQHAESQPLIIIPDEIQTSAASRLQGTPEDPSWWNKWGLALGGALAALGSLSELATMRLEVPEYNPSTIERFEEYIAKPKTAIRLGIAVVLLLAIGPAFFSGVRPALLEFLNPNIATQYEEVVSARKKQIVYSELTKSSWPMAKLIGDALNCTPVGIDIESIRLDVGEPISIRGRVIPADGYSAAELISIMEQKLASYRVFKDIRLSYDSAGTYDDRKFDISASVMNPLRRPKYAKEDDFGTWTLAMRQVGIAPGEDGDTIEETDIYPEEPSSILGGTNVDSIPSSETPAFAGDTIPRDERAPRGLGGST
ncbi:MAG: hypothetical protein QGF07_01340, partial [Phycisphaerales bacterium]|nr:hypothetical protein [Phycisphaerales bacterium]